jgi:hypothetical protein
MFLFLFFGVGYPHRRFARELGTGMGGAGCLTVGAAGCAFVAGLYILIVHVVDE